MTQVGHIVSLSTHFLDGVVGLAFGWTTGLGAVGFGFGSGFFGVGLAPVPQYPQLLRHFFAMLGSFTQYV